MTLLQSTKFTHIDSNDDGLVDIIRSYDNKGKLNKVVLFSPESRFKREVHYYYPQKTIAKYFNKRDLYKVVEENYGPNGAIVQRISFSKTKNDKGFSKKIIEDYEAEVIILTEYSFADNSWTLKQSKRSSRYHSLSMAKCQDQEEDCVQSRQKNPDEMLATFLSSMNTNACESEHFFHPGNLNLQIDKTCDQDAIEKVEQAYASIDFNCMESNYPQLNFKNKFIAKMSDPHRGVKVMCSPTPAKVAANHPGIRSPSSYMFPTLAMGEHGGNILSLTGALLPEHRSNMGVTILHEMLHLIGVYVDETHDHGNDIVYQASEHCGVQTL